MEIKVNLAFCALVFLTCSSHIRGQSTSVFNISTPAYNLTEVLTTTPIAQTTTVSGGSIPEFTASVENQTVPIVSKSSTLSTLFPEGPTTNSTINDTTGIPLVSTLHPTSQVPLNQTTTDLPVTIVSIRSSPPANGTIARTVTQSPREGTHPTTDSLSVSSNRPATSASHATLAHSSPSPSAPPLLSVPTQPAATSSLSTTSAATANPQQDTPSELNVGDEDEPSGTTLDPLLAGLVSVFVVSAAIVSLLLFLKFRQRNEGPEFRRLQDLPMDDMMEDTPLSMFSY